MATKLRCARFLNYSAAELKEAHEPYGMEADKLKEYMGDAEKNSMKRELSITKAIDIIMSSTKERAKAKSKKEKDADAEETEE